MEQRASQQTPEEMYFELPEDVRAELIDGKIYYMASPSTDHQRISRKLTVQIDRHINEKKMPRKKTVGNGCLFACFGAQVINV